MGPRVDKDQQQYDLMKMAMSEALDDKIKQFYSTQEEFYKDILFLKSMRQAMENCKSACLKAVIASLTVLILAGVAAVVYFMKSPFQGGGQ